MQKLQTFGFTSTARWQRAAGLWAGFQRRLICRVCHSASPQAPVSSGAMNKGRGRRPVVTAFVRRDDGKLLVVKRSDQVSTYQQQWGGVSGGVEGSESLINRVLTEILEEVGLSPHQLQLVCFGRPLTVDDGPKQFLVHPFLFQLVDSSAHITLNWENVDYDWVPTSAVPQLNHVPLLPETMRRLLLPPYMQQHIDYLKADRQHGAAQLAAHVIAAVRTALTHEENTMPAEITYPSSSSNSGDIHPSQAAVAGTEQQQQQQQQFTPVQPTFEGFMEAYSNFCFHMAVARPSMAAVANAAASVLLQLQHELAARADAFEPTVGMARLALSDAVSKLSLQLQQQQVTTISNMSALLRPGMMVMTTSLSSTVATALIQAHQQTLVAAKAPVGSEQPTPPVQAQQQYTGQSPPTAGAPVHAFGGTDVGLATSSGIPEETPTAAAADGCMPRHHGTPLPSGIEGQDAVDDVDDLNFWPSSSGIGPTVATRDCSSWVARLGQRRQARIAAAAAAEASSGSSPSHPGSHPSRPGISVVVCESRPLCEGVIMAQRLADAGLDVTVITDAQASVFVDEVDLVLLGADAVTPAGVVNKVGSRLLALAAMSAGVPLVALTDSLKISPGPLSSLALPHTPLSGCEEEKDSDELLEGWGQELAQQVQQYMRKQQSKPVGYSVEGTSPAPQAAAATNSSTSRPQGRGDISIRNVYFESVPVDWLSGLMTDQGLLTSEQVAQLIQQRVKDYRQAFDLTAAEDTLPST